jgi:hypothetical protein
MSSDITLSAFFSVLSSVEPLSSRSPDRMIWALRRLEARSDPSTATPLRPPLARTSKILSLLVLRGPRPRTPFQRGEAPVIIAAVAALVVLE